MLTQFGHPNVFVQKMLGKIPLVDVFIEVSHQNDCVTTQEKSDSEVNVKLKKKLTLLENYECLG